MAVPHLKVSVWCGATDRNLATLQPQDIDAYFVTYGAQRWSRISAGQIAKMLRVFLRHAATTGACSAYSGWLDPRGRRYALESLPYALSWDDVRRVIATASGDSERDIRDRAILLLLAVYGLRRGEVASLRLDQIDRVAGGFTSGDSSAANPRSTRSCRPWRRRFGRYIDDVRPRRVARRGLHPVQAPRHPIRPRPSTPSSAGGFAHWAYRLLTSGLMRCAIRAQPSCWPTD
jgi:integrase/recombinase XerD